ILKKYNELQNVATDNFKNNLLYKFGNNNKLKFIIMYYTHEQNMHYLYFIKENLKPPTQELIFTQYQINENNNDLTNIKLHNMKYEIEQNEFVLFKYMLKSQNVIYMISDKNPTIISNNEINTNSTEIWNSKLVVSTGKVLSYKTTPLKKY